MRASILSGLLAIATAAGCGGTGSEDWRLAQAGNGPPPKVAEPRPVDLRHYIEPTDGAIIEATMDGERIASTRVIGQAEIQLGPDSLPYWVGPPGVLPVLARRGPDGSRGAERPEVPELKLCYYCGGSGKTHCTHCIGGIIQGYGNPYQDPPTPPVDCPVCGKSTMMRCPECGGTGKVY